jgi:hypothetical protein
MSTFTLYHGSSADFQSVDLTRSKNRRDFGRGFYMTTLRDQAERWASVVFARYEGVAPILYVFELELADCLKYKQYDGLTIEWLEMVKENRVRGGIQHEFDVMRGPVADDDTMLVISLYLDGTLSAENALRELSFFRPNDQVSIHTPAALEYLTLREKVKL